MANRRFEMHQYRHVLVQMRLGETDRQIARAGLMGRRKAAQLRRQAAALGWLDLARPLPASEALAAQLRPPAPRPQATSQVEPYAADVRQWRADGCQGTTIHQALVRKHGFTGSYSAVRRFLQGLAGIEPSATTVLEFAPGDAAQIDFGRGPRITDAHSGERFGTWIFTMVLAWSRYLYAELVRDQSVPTWLACHQHAFEFFGGVPQRLIIDNPKCAITRACYYDPAVQRAYADLAEGYGCRLAPLPVAAPQMKGRIEAGVKYVKRSFVPLRELRSLGDGNHQLRAWLVGPAGNRTHGTTRQRPLTRFLETERYLLQPLPPRRVEALEWAQVKVPSDAHVQFAQCRYSVPWQLVGQRLWLCAGATTVRLFRDGELLAIHPRLSRPGARATVDEHLPPAALAYKRHDAAWCTSQARQIGPACTALLETLFADRVLDNLRAAQGIIRLASSYGPTRLEAACARANAFATPRYRTVKTILDKGADLEPVPGAAVIPLAPTYTGQGRFCRDATVLLAPRAPRGQEVPA